MFRIIRVPAALDKFVRPLNGPFHGDHVTYFRLLVLAMAVMWGRRHVANLYRHLEVEHHRTRVNNFFWVERWDPEAALRPKAQARLRALRPAQGETIDVSSDDSKTAKGGKTMDAVATMKDPPLEASIRGHQDVCGLLLFRGQVIPVGIRRYVKKALGAALALPFRKTTAWAAPRIQEFQAPAGVQVLVLFEAYDLCQTVVKACREKTFPVAATLKSHRSLFKQGWKLKAGRSGKHRFRRRRTEVLEVVKPQGRLRYRYSDAGWLPVSNLGVLPVVFSRNGAARKILGFVSDDPHLSDAGLIQAYEQRWAIEPWIKDAKPLLGLGQYQKRPYWAAVTHLHRVCFADALLTHLRIARAGAPGQQTRHKAADLSTAAAQEQRRGLIWEDLVAYLKEPCHGESVLAALARLRVA
jgi:hypothetical protein